MTRLVLLWLFFALAPFDQLVQRRPFKINVSMQEQARLDRITLARPAIWHQFPDLIGSKKLLPSALP